nr:hypothetical protein [Planctomycetota bacterium]
AWNHIYAAAGWIDDHVSSLSRSTGRAAHGVRTTARRAWQALGAPKRRPAAEALPATPPTCFFACAACAHESLLLGVGKYSTFRCPACDARLTIVHPERGLTVVSTARGSDSALEVETDIPTTRIDRVTATDSGSAGAGGPGRSARERSPSAASGRRSNASRAR